MSRFDRKRIFQRDVVKNIAKCCFQPTIEQNPAFKKECYSMSGFEAKRIFKIKMVKLLQNAVFNTN